MKKSIRILILLNIVIVLICSMHFGNTTLAGQEMRTQVLYLAGIIDNDMNMNELLSRGEFAKMIAKSSKYKDSVSSISQSDVFKDVKKDNQYASYIKLVAKEGYMSGYLGGMFRPENAVTYRDLVRAIISLLGYTNEDFVGDQINGRYELFCSLDLNENIIDRDINGLVNKKDCVNAIYNMLKAKNKSGQTYGTSNFNLSINSDGELNASGLLKVKMNGPYILKKGQSLSQMLPFDVNLGNYFLNGSASSFGQIERETGNIGYMIIYYNIATKTCYAYKEGTSPDTTVCVTKGYVEHIYYNASDNLTPQSVEIDRGRFHIGSSEVKFALSYAGTIKVGDQVVFIYEKSNDTDSEADYTYAGTISAIYLYDVNY